MIVGTITCKCNQLFGFETVSEYVNCPHCGEKYKSLYYGKEEIIEEVIEEVISDEIEITEEQI